MAMDIKENSVPQQLQGCHICPFILFHLPQHRKQAKSHLSSIYFKVKLLQSKHKKWEENCCTLACVHQHNHISSDKHLLIIQNQFFFFLFPLFFVLLSFDFLTPPSEETACCASRWSSGLASPFHPELLPDRLESSILINELTLVGRKDFTSSMFTLN